MNHRVEVALDKLQYVFFIAIVAALISFFFIPCDNKDKREGLLSKLDICKEVEEVAVESELLNDAQIEDLVHRCRTQGS